MVQQKTHSQSGVVEIEGDKIRWSCETGMALSLHLSDVIVIGEYANSDGPFFDDWFLVLVTKQKNCFEISMYADKIDDLRKILAERYHPDIALYQLANSTEWRSVVIYPLEFRGTPLFKSAPSKHYKEPENIGQKLAYALGFGHFDSSEEMSLSQNIKQYIELVCR
jgi:hypothetical protein